MTLIFNKFPTRAFILLKLNVKAEPAALPPVTHIHTLYTYISAELFCLAPLHGTLCQSIKETIVMFMLCIVLGGQMAEVVR